MERKVQKVKRGKRNMKPRIRKKGCNQDKTTRYCLEYIDSEGNFRSIALNPKKLLEILDTSKKSKISKEKEE